MFLCSVQSLAAGMCWLGTSTVNTQRASVSPICSGLSWPVEGKGDGQYDMLLQDRKGSRNYGDAPQDQDSLAASTDA